MSETSPQFPTPKSLKSDGDSLVIEWDDGVVHRLSWRLLRDTCPCATCRIERDKPPESAEPVAALLPVLSVAEAQPLKPTAVRPMGNYAYAIHFNDGHNTGIYALDFLRALGEQAAAAM